MPELPEVETTRLSLIDKLESYALGEVIVRQPKLRWPIPLEIIDQLPGQTVHALKRRAKYLILELSDGQVIIHLGMSGHLKWVELDAPWEKHDHVGFQINHHWLRLNDPRRFGAFLYQPHQTIHPLFKHLGPEPLEKHFNADWLLSQLAKRQTPIKSCIMDQKIVVGVGNIYASEALFLSGIHPLTPANRLEKPQAQKLVKTIKHVLKQAIKSGGTTLRDFKDGSGKRGYFQQQLHVYGKEGEPCPECFTPILKKVIQQRSSFFCSICQNF